MADIRIIPSTGLVNVTGSIDFTSGGSTMLFMTGSSRNVGIGTTAPSTKLEVGNFLDAVTNKITVAARYEYEPEFNFRLGQSGTNLDWIGAVISSGDDGNYNGKILFKTANAGRDTPTTKMAIKASGYVGIGTVSPSTTLDILGKIKLGLDGTYGGSDYVTIGFGGTSNGYNRVFGYNGTADGLYLTSATGHGITFRINGGSTDNMYLNSSGNLGIGVTTPSQKLEVTGNIYATGYVQGSTAYISDQSGVSSFGSNSSTRSIRVGRDGTANDIFITGSSGNVGIGITTPAFPLHVARSSGDSVIVVDSGASSNSQFRFQEAGSLTAAITFVSSDDSLRIYNGGDRLNILSSGNVGIGITTPGATLVVGTQSSGQSGTGVAGDNSLVARFGASNAAARVTGVTVANTATATVANDATLSFVVAGNYSATGLISSILQNTSTAATDMAFSVYNNSMQERMRLTAGGSLGIGTSVPDSLLHIYGSGNTFARYRNTTSTGHYVDMGANSAGESFVYSYGAYPLLIGTNGATRMTVLSGGNVGIGTTSPSNKLQVVGGVTATSFTGSLSGNAATATTATNADSINITQVNDDSSYQVTFTTTNTSGYSPLYIDEDNSHLTYNPSTRTLTSATFVGNLTGNADTATSATSAGSATTATNVAWSGVSAGYRENYDLGFRPADNSSSYSGFRFGTPGNDANAGYFLIRGGADTDVYTQNGITLVADAGWLTLAQRTTAGKGVRIMTGTTSTERLTVLEGGNVGIGTTSPAAKLHVSGSDAILRNAFIGEVPTYGAANSQFSHISRAGAGEYSFLSANDGETFINSKTGYNINFRVNNSNVAIITSAGSVGIGTTSPINGSKFEVRGSGVWDGGVITLTNTGTSGRSWSIFSTNASFDQGAGKLLVYNTTAGTNSMVIDSNNNVGIGTTSPSSILQLLPGPSYATNASYNSFQAGSFGVLFRNAYDSYITFNTTYSPSGWVNKYDTYKAGVMQITDGRFSIDLGTGTGAGSASSLVERFAILNNGNVGIGVTNPAYKLDVVGGDVRIMNTSGPTLNFSDNVDQNWDMGVDASLNDFYIKNGISGVRHLTVKTGGNVGIGTTNPAAKLHVSGTADVFLAKGSGSATNTTIMAVDGNNGRLFEVSDDLSDSLFSVNTIAGLPVIEAFADYTVTMGSYNKSDLVVTGSKVGIGTPNPQRKLDVYDSGSQIVAQFSSSNASSVRIKFSDANTASENVNIGAIGTRMALWTNNTERLSILSGGNVGIGTTSPGAKLDVTGTGLFGNTTSGWYVSPSQLHVGGTGTAQISLEDVGLSTAAIALDGDNFAFGHQNPSPTYTFKYSNTYNGNYATTGTTFVQFNPTTNYINSGNVGIGTTAPDAKLVVVGQGTGLGKIGDAGFGSGNYTGISLNGTLSTANYNILSSPTDSTLYINRPSGASISFREANGGAQVSIISGGNVGISTTSPEAALHIAKTGTDDQLVLGSAATNRDIAMFMYSGTTKAEVLRFQSAFRLLIGNGSAITQQSFFTSGTEKMTITSAGNVGIGTTNPSFPLHVVGYARASGFSVNDGSGTVSAFIGYEKNWIGSGTSATLAIAAESQKINFYAGGTTDVRMMISSSGAVGIGTTAPGADLHIDSGNSGAATYALRTDTVSLDYALYVSSSGNVAIGGLVPAAALNHKLTVFSGSIALRGPNNSLFSYRLNDTSGVNRNALYVSSSNYLNVGNAAFAGLELFHTGSAPGSNNIDSGASRYYGTDQTYYLAEPNKWLAVRINNVNYVMPMYEV